MKSRRHRAIAKAKGEKFMDIKQTLPMRNFNYRRNSRIKRNGAAR